MRTVIAAHNGRQEGLDAVARGRQIADAAGARLLVVHVMEKQSPYSSTDRRYQHDLREDLAGIFGPARMVGGPGTETRAIGANSVVDALAGVVDEEQAAVVVIGPSHHGPVGHVLYGDVARQLERQSDCYVEVAPAGTASLAAAA